MSFTHGKAARVYLDAVDMSDYMRSASFSSDADTADSSVFGSDDKSYVTGMRDATFSGEGILDQVQDAAVIPVLGSADRSVLQYYPKGDTIGNPGRGLSADLTSYEPSSPLGDVVQFSVEAQSSVGSERIISHHAHGQETASGTATVVDGTAQTTDGAVGYLNVTAVSGSAVIVVQDSADNVTYVDLLSFGTVSTTGGQRGTVTGTVDRYTRLVHTNAAGTITFVAGLGRVS